jgi:transposase
LKFGVKYTAEGVVRLLHRLKFSYKKSRQIPCEGSNVQQLNFIKIFNDLNNYKSKKEAIYFSDAVHPQHNTRTSYGWIKTGKDKEIPSVSGRNRLNLNGLLNANDVTDIIVQACETVNYQSIIEIYKELELRNPDKEKIFVICDNAKYYKNKELQKWLSTSKIEQFFLPPYSPNLNIIERLWKFLRKEVIDSTFYRKFEDFRNSILDFFKNIKNYESELSSLLTLNFELKNANQF